LVRQSNEDAFLAEPAKGLFAVADGLGGHLAGEVASSQALKILQQYFSSRSSAPTPELLAEAVKQANSHVFRLAQNSPNRNGMGTTLTAVLLSDYEALIAHVGDSRAYLLTDEGLQQITEDHSYVGELLRQGQISEAEARHHPRRNMLTQALGVEPELEIRLNRVQLLGIRLLLLCTDGVSGVLENKAIEKLLQGPKSLEDKVEAICQAVLERGAPDNLTVILVKP